MIDYGTIIDLDSLTLADCINLYDNQKLISVIHDGKVVNLELEVDK